MDDGHSSSLGRPAIFKPIYYSRHSPPPPAPTKIEPKYSRTRTSTSNAAPKYLDRGRTWQQSLKSRRRKISVWGVIIRTGPLLSGALSDLLTLSQETVAVSC